MREAAEAPAMDVPVLGEEAEGDSPEAVPWTKSPSSAAGGTKVVHTAPSTGSSSGNCLAQCT